MKNIFKVSILIPLFALYPFVAFAQSSGSCFTAFSAGGKLGDLFTYVSCTIASTVIPLIFSIAVVSFIWGVVQFVINADDAEKKEKGRSFMIWGIIGLTVMVGVWGLVKILATTFGLNSTFLPQLPPPRP